MRNIWYLALVSYKDSIRKRILWVFLIFSFVLIFTSVALKVISLERASVFDQTAGLAAADPKATEEKMTKDMGIASIATFAVLILLFTAASQIPEEIEGRTLYTLMTFPLKRRHIVLGKFLGQVLVILTVIPVMTAILYIGLLVRFKTFDPLVLKGIYTLMIQLSVLTSVCVMLSTVAPVNFNIIFCFVLFLAGHTTGHLKALARGVSFLPAKWGLAAAGTLIPNFEYFNLSNELTLKSDVSFAYLFSVTLYGLIYMTAMLLIAVAAFRDRQI
jgi:ABC-type transport system involved in multi-copper enzyme maturation permease subunit